MGKLTVFNFITLNGYYKGPQDDTSWHVHGAEENNFAAGNLHSVNNTLLFGRVTYEMMAGYWPTPQAMAANGVVAEGMNRAEKIVFSRTLKKAAWSNSRIIKDDMIGEIKKLKERRDHNLTLLGSGTLLTQLADHNLVDEYQLMIDPIALGAGTPLLKGLKHTLNLKLTLTKTFRSGVVLLYYHPQQA